MFLIVAPGSQIGQMVAQSICDSQRHVRILSNSSVPDAELPSGVSVFRGDISDLESLRLAMQGVQAVLLNTHIPFRKASEQLNVVRMADECGVGHLLTIGLSTPKLCLPLLLDVWQQELRSRCKAAAMRVTHFWTSCPMQVILPMADLITSMGVFRTPLMKGRHPVVDQHDVAEAVAAVMLAPDLGGREYLLTGPAAVSAADVSAALSDVLGRSISFAPVSTSQTRAEKMALGWLPEQVDAMIELLEAIEFGYLNTVSSEVEALIGRPARSVREFVMEHQALFEPAETDSDSGPQIKPLSA